VPFKFNISAGRWVWDIGGVSEAEVRARGGCLPRPRPVTSPSSPAPAPASSVGVTGVTRSPTALDRAYVRLRAQAKAAATWAAKRAAKAKELRKAASLERARVRNKAYQHGYYLRVTKARRAERREAARV
jgi:hypothetical protein